MQTLITVLLLGALLSGCTGKLSYKKHNSRANDGIPIRLTESRTVYWTHTAREDVADCTPSLQSEIQDNAPSRDRYALAYEAKKFERSKIQFTLNDNGTLKSVNTESTPISVDDLVKAAEAAARIMSPVPVPAPAPPTTKEEGDAAAMSIEKEETFQNLEEIQKEVLKAIIKDRIRRATTKPCTTGKLIVHSCPEEVGCLSEAQKNFTTWRDKGR